MDDRLNHALDEASRPFADGRFNLCRLSVAEQFGQRIMLEGDVLDTPTRTAVLAELTRQTPDAHWDLSRVRVLRGEEPARRQVHTSMTGLYREPSWLAEQQTQLLNGAVVEVLEDRETWSFVRQSDGYLGWAYRGYLGPADGAAEPTHMVAAPVGLLRESPTAEALMASRVFAGTMVSATAGAAGWAEVTLAGGLCGYLLATELRPLPLEPGDGTRAQLVTDALPYMGVPYLWGGNTALGIDCSGYAQLLHKLAGVVIPRDADRQYLAGTPVEPPFRAGDLLYFGGPGGHRRVSHVGVSLGPDYDPDGWRIIHSSRSRNGVYVDDVQAGGWLQERYLGARRFLE